jgi:5-methylcytosine-specific restriction endonuclease McrA
MPKSKAKSLNDLEWREKFLLKVALVHVRKKDDVVTRILKRVTTVRNGMMARSKKYEVECSVTVDELRQLILDAYGTKCRYCEKVLKLNTLVIDHIVPISKGGASNIDNLQVICKTSNSMKGSLTEENFFILLNWLKTAPEELSRDISIRLARGII